MCVCVCSTAHTDRQAGRQSDRVYACVCAPHGHIDRLTHTDRQQTDRQTDRQAGSMQDEVYPQYLKPN